MKIKKLPFNIDFLPDTRNTFLGLLPVMSLQILESKTGDFHPHGLYSNLIFGKQGEEARFDREGFLDLKVPIFHPLYYKTLISLKGLYKEILEGTGYALWDEEEKDFIRAGVVEGDTGFAFFIKHFPDLVFKRNRSKARSLKIDLLEKYRDQCFIQHFIVIPAGLRDIEFDEGHPKEEDINGLYRRVIGAVNTITAGRENKNSAAFDAAKTNIQKAVLEIYLYLFNMLDGKKGALQGKYAARRVAGMTRNVLSSQEVGGAILGDERQPGLNTTTVGVYQFIKGCVPYLTRYAFKQKFMREFFENLKYEVSLIDQKTLKAVDVTLSDAARDRWATNDGLEELINTFEDPKLAHKPANIDGYYLKLIYQDDKAVKIMDSIEELKEGFDKSHVRPMTWLEFYYLHVVDFVPKTRGFVTRYPITGLGSIYASEVYLKTTSTGLDLRLLDDDWNDSGQRLPEFPNTLTQDTLFQTMAVSPYMLVGLGADKGIPFLRERR